MSPPRWAPLDRYPGMNTLRWASLDEHHWMDTPRWAPLNWHLWMGTPGWTPLDGHPSSPSTGTDPATQLPPRGESPRGGPHGTGHGHAQCDSDTAAAGVSDLGVILDHPPWPALGRAGGGPALGRRWLRPRSWGWARGPRLPPGCNEGE